MTFDGSALRQSSDAPLPFRDRGVTLVRLGCDGVVEQARTLEEKRDVLAHLRPNDGLLAAWTGQHRTDVFWVDKVAQLRDAVA